jgi:hypothetical protein
MSKALSYLRSNALGALALFVALGGTSYAATGGFTAASRTIKACAASNGVLRLQTGKKCKKGQKAVSWNQQGVPGAPGATGPSGIAGLNGAAVPNATNATNATTATTAQTANNALALGGIPVSGFTQRDCASETGQMKGFAQAPGTGLTAKYVPVAPAYNCSGGAIEAKSTGTGHYQVRFAGNKAEVPLATTLTAGGNVDPASVRFIAPGEWEVETTKQSGFSLVLFG